MLLKKIFMAFALITAMQGFLSAHGVKYSVSHEKAVVLQALFDTGEPMAYAQVRIFSPDDSEIEYQNGRTDRGGRFAFFPDTEGEWTVRTDDGTGHGFTAVIDVDEIKETPIIEGGLTRFQKLIAAAAIAWGFLGFAFYFKARRSG